jgi:hypothetical protein
MAPSRALVASPLMRALETGKIARIEELTRITADVQDTLITVLSEKTLPIPELNEEVQATRGFNVIATANDRDRGVNELSSALKRRFNTVVLPLPETAEEEVDIVERRVARLGRALELPAEPPALEEINAWSPSSVSCARPTADGKTKLKSPSRRQHGGNHLSHDECPRWPVLRWRLARTTSGQVARCDRRTRCRTAWCGVPKRSSKSAGWQTCTAPPGDDPPEQFSTR